MFYSLIGYCLQLHNIYSVSKKKRKPGFDYKLLKIEKKDITELISVHDSIISLL